MKKSAKRVKKFLKPQKVKPRKESPFDTADVENAVGDGGPQSSLSKELKEMVTPILDIVPEKDYEGVFTETATEIQALSEDIATILTENKEKQNPLKLCKQKITNFFAKCFLKPRKVKQRKESPFDTADVENAVGDGGPQSSLSKELKEMVTHILDIVPEKDYEGVFTETATEIQALSEDIATILTENKEKKNPLKLCKQKITNFFAKCFLNVWIRRLISQLRKQHPRLRRGDSSESVRS
ncbi:hypothetical protein D4764_19G0001860 [Takifugu flavidus]|uniref:Uncharacterized protein n=1 Tax=Takifugu flavidus TaxID=433684 RepID=A0A5C6NNT2_9TELE|nr:hypothetical protein D4764_19G0001860 [Takifugu flavidus]